MAKFLEPYAVRAIYVDPSAAAFKLELRKRGLHIVDADNDVLNGIDYFVSEMRKGSVTICKDCPTMIKEIEGYVWDHKASEKGYDEPLKKNDHCMDAARYCLYTHKVAAYNPYQHNPAKYAQNRFSSNF